MEESESGIHLQELPTDDQVEAKIEEDEFIAKRLIQGMLIPSLGKC